VRHFSTGSFTGGSFIRLRKLDLGVSLDQKLLEEKYVKPDAELVAPDNLLPHYALTSSGREKAIEFFGELKIRSRQQLSTLERISLRCLGISRASAHPLQKICIKEVDLAGNLLSDWIEVENIIRQFSNLESISLAANRVMDIPLQHSVWDLTTFESIKILNLNRCGITSFATLKILSTALPNLEELCVAHNDFNDMGDFDGSISEYDTNGNIEYSKSVHEKISTSPAMQYFQKLRFLDMSDCKLTSWNRQIVRLRFLPLEHIILNDNPISSIFIDPNEPLFELSFANVESIQLAGCDVQSWSSIDYLRHLPRLRSIRFRNNPVLNNMGAGEARSIIISRLPRILYLNASSISIKERMEAERRYIKNVARELMFADDSNDSNTRVSEIDEALNGGFKKSKDLILAMHPLFNELVTKHGEDMLSINSSRHISGGKLANETINVTIRSMAASSCTMEPLRKRLPGSLKVGRLKIMCTKAFQLDIDHQTLHFRTEDDSFPIALDDDENPLSYYGVHDGSEILMSETYL